MKNYIKGNFKVVTTKYGDMYNLSLNLEEINALPAEKGYVKITVAKKKDADSIEEDWKKYSIFENDYQPKGKFPPSKEQSQSDM